MALPVPNLDDRRFQDLVDDAKRLVQQRCPEWTDHNVSDPGVTLIELFAWMTDQLRLPAEPRAGPALRQVPGADRGEPLPADGRAHAGHLLAGGRRSRTRSGSRPARRSRPSGPETDEAIVFGTTEDLPIVPCELARARLDGRRQDLSRPVGLAREGHRHVLVQGGAAAGRRPLHRPHRAGPLECRPAALQVPHRGRRRGPEQPAARLGGLERRGVGALRARLRHDRRSQPRRRHRHPRAQGSRRLADRQAPGRLDPRSGHRAGGGPAGLQRLAEHRRAVGDHHRRDRRRRQCRARRTRGPGLFRGDAGPGVRAPAAPGCARRLPRRSSRCSRTTTGSPGRWSTISRRVRARIAISGWMSAPGRPVSGPASASPTGRSGPTARCRPKAPAFASGTTGRVAGSAATSPPAP